ncbi:type II toxin-antitoxin system toxin DNA ADP-ribosyl transferase DarT [Mucilaginibacter glaciei]|nr:DUF4433 domain-containing protein [Mucilaginibacter glaciei]
MLYCYRITHRDNLPHILSDGLVNKNHHKAAPDFVAIGNPEIIDVRSTTLVGLDSYGYIGEYIPFYFTPRSIMLYNIVTGYYHPRVPQRSRDEIIVIRCLAQTLAERPKWFFTDGQANDGESGHYADLKELSKIDWDCIQNSQFSKADDYDRPRRYQAEFLVKDIVPAECFESICVYSKKMQLWAQTKVNAAGKMLKVNVIPEYFFQ